MEEPERGAGDPVPRRAKPCLGSGDQGRAGADPGTKQALPREGPEAVSVPTTAAASLFTSLPASALPGGRPQGPDFCSVIEAASVRMQLRKGTPALLQGVSKGPGDAAEVPHPVLCPEPMPAPPVSWAPAQPPADRRTAGMSQARA